VNKQWTGYLTLNSYFILQSWHVKPFLRALISLFLKGTEIKSLRPSHLHLFSFLVNTK